MIKNFKVEGSYFFTDSFIWLVTDSDLFCIDRMSKEWYNRPFDILGIEWASYFKLKCTNYGTFLLDYEGCVKL